ncbi:MAG: glycosyltransferase [Syntrophobacteraceae bacterium]
MLSYKIRLYHHAKSFIPRRLQIALRRRIVRYQLEKDAGTWPIYEPAKEPPPGWTGWPDKKKFALVLTHDVDSQKGLDNCLKLADVEERLGFRSAFNFVACEYEVPPQTRAELTARGFEVGLHGLYHSSLLYHSREEFLRQVPEINRALKEWNAVGFRSPCMYHNLEWMHDLDIEYDASTFDTDPFEPQPHGLGSIFPLYIPKGSMAGGYVELPYTLPQDFTLFVLMQHRTTEVWLKKLGWIARSGGMALLNVHPDYANFGTGKYSCTDYDAKLYCEFLEHVKTVYRDQYWHPLPREIARFWAKRSKILPKKKRRSGTHPDALDLKENPSLRMVTAAKAAGRGRYPAGLVTNTQRQQVAATGETTEHFSGSPPQTVPRLNALNVSVIAYTFYEMDSRVRRYAEALAARGDHVDVVALKYNGLPSYDIIKGVHVYRIQDRVLNEKGKFSYLSRLVRFLVNSAVFVSRKHIRTKYDLVHVHSVPDFEVFAALIPKLTGAKIILDIHDIVPEFYASKFNVARTSLVYKALEWLERVSVKFSDHVIIANHIWEKKLVSRSAPAFKCSTFLNYPDLSIFYCRPQQPHNGKFLLVYPGSLNWHQGLDVAIKGFAIAAKEIENAEFHIYGGGPEEKSLRTLAAELGLEKKVLFKGSLPLDAIAEVMAGATAAVVPKRNDPFGGDAFSTKVFEFMALGVPVILSKTRIDDFYFDDSVVRFFEPENCRELADAIATLALDANKRQTLAANAQEFVKGLSWDEKKQDYYCLVHKLLEQ